jgi:hypothetical protein
VHVVTREAALIDFTFLALHRSSRQLAKGIEPFEFQSAVIAKKFMQAG